MKKKMVSVLLTVSLVSAALMGCGSSEQVTDKQEDSQSSGQGDIGEADTGEEEDMAEIAVTWMTLSATDSDQTDAVEEAINEITESTINTHVDIQFYDPATYATQVPMMIQAGEKLDLVMYTPVPGAGYESFKSQNQLLEISDLLAEYGSGVTDAVGELIKGTTSEDGTYGVVANHLLEGSLYVIMRKDILDDLGLTEKAENMTTWTEYEEILQEVTDKTDLAGVANNDAEGSVLCVAPYNLGSDSFAENSSYDNLGDTYNLICADEATDQVSCIYLTDEYAQAAKRANEWYNKGLIYKDSATSQDGGEILMKNDAVFSVVEQSEMGIELTKATTIGHDLICTKITNNQISTQMMYKFGFALPVTATEPEAAMKFLNLCYSNADIENIFAWGVEGRDWVVNENGEGSYPEGVTAETVLYHMADFLNGNQFITMPWEGSQENLRDLQIEAQNSAPVSKYMGFTFDSSKVETEITACFNVQQQYKPGLSSGSVADYETTYTEFKDKLGAAGIDKVIAEYQSQLDAWLAQQ